MRKYGLLFVIVVLTALLAGYHTRADSTDELFSACYNQTNGVLRRVTSASDCKTAEVFVSWNIQGLEGPPGPKGDSGISKVFSYSNPLGAPVALSDFTTIVPNNIIVGSLNLPAGKYSASGKVTVYASNTVSVQCVLATGTAAEGLVDDTYSSGPDSTTVTVQGTFEITEPKKLAMYCGGTGNSRYSQLSAIQVNEIETQ
jgi:hypothetical protein